MLLAVTFDPLWVTVAFHAWVTCWPAPKDQVNVQPETGSLRFFTVTFAPNPPDHCELIAYVTEHSPLPGVGVGVGVGVGLVVSPPPYGTPPASADRAAS